MNDVYETNAPREFPNPKAQPEIEEKKAIKTGRDESLRA